MATKSKTPTPAAERAAREARADRLLLHSFREKIKELTAFPGEDSRERLVTLQQLLRKFPPALRRAPPLVEESRPVLVA
jgi:hypothetical protein